VFNKKQNVLIGKSL